MDALVYYACAVLLAAVGFAVLLLWPRRQSETEAQFQILAERIEMAKHELGLALLPVIEQMVNEMAELLERLGD